MTDGLQWIPSRQLEPNRCPTETELTLEDSPTVWLLMGFIFHFPKASSEREQVQENFKELEVYFPTPGQTLAYQMNDSLTWVKIG